MESRDSKDRVDEDLINEQLKACLRELDRIRDGESAFNREIEAANDELDHIAEMKDELETMQEEYKAGENYYHLVEKTQVLLAAAKERFGSLDEAIQELILDEMGNLYDEPARLFRDEVSDIAPYSSIMLAVGSGKQKYSSISDALGKTTAELAKPIKILTEMAFLRKEVPFGENPQKTKKILYRIDDPFMAFYYRFIEPNKSMIALGRGNIAKKFINDGFNGHVAEVWERLCQLAVSGSNIEGHTWGEASRWWGKVPIFEEGKKTPVGNEELEFDVVAEDLFDKNTILVGECKWTAPDYADRLLEKLKRFS